MASGTVVDWRRRPSAWPDAPLARLSARASLAEAVRSALVCDPCVVAFSGGRDSSAMLALAADVARREGLSPPIPVTLRFADAPAADEASWQELVIKHVGVADWLRVPIGDELDMLGPYAQRALRSHGVVHPSNAYCMAPFLERAAGGAVITGVFGDQLFEGWGWRPTADARAGRRRTTPRIAARRATSRLPIPAREWLHARRDRGPGQPPWLHPALARVVDNRVARARALESPRWPDWLAQFSCRLADEPNRSPWDLLGRDYGARLVQPFADQGFLRAMAQEGGRDGFGGRAETMARLFGDLLPVSLVQRPTKAHFPLLGRQTADFAGRWDGGGLPLGLVDAECLREAVDDYRASYLWQYLWLHNRGQTA